MDQQEITVRKPEPTDDEIREPNEPLTVEFAASRYANGVLESRNISLAREIPYTLFVNDVEVLSIAVLPTHLDELFIGFLVAEGARL